mmetsp:Transcript_59836/g.164686  ORF Transcript_59836/g.164686 Transcript_59836/m.164686 type:complete len:300 (+) Transcript_59836:479-1378(+)
MATARRVQRLPSSLLNSSRSARASSCSEAPTRRSTSLRLVLSSISFRSFSMMPASALSSKLPPPAGRFAISCFIATSTTVTISRTCLLVGTSLSVRATSWIDVLTEPMSTSCWSMKVCSASSWAFCAFLIAGVSLAIFVISAVSAPIDSSSRSSSCSRFSVTLPRTSARLCSTFEICRLISCVCLASSSSMRTARSRSMARSWALALSFTELIISFFSRSSGFSRSSASASPSALAAASALESSGPFAAPSLPAPSTRAPSAGLSSLVSRFFSASTIRPRSFSAFFLTASTMPFIVFLM